MSYGILPNGKQQFIDSNGNPLAGGKVYYYIPSTTTFKNTYQDDAGSSLNTNPVVLDASGQCIAYGTGSYRQQVFDVNNNLIWDQQVDTPLTAADWRELLFLAHTDKSAAFKKYSQHYLSTDGQLYASDSFQMSTYFENYHEELDKRLTNNPRGTEVITELYVPPQALPAFLRDCAALLQKHKANVIYGTVRMIEPDLETFLPWAKERAACIIFNLHVEHSELGLAQAKPAFQALIQTAISYGGSYYLTYHRFATGQQLLTCYPQLIEFVEQKILFDPDRMFSSTWFDYICDCLLTQADPCLAGTGV